MDHGATRSDSRSPDRANTCSLPTIRTEPRWRALVLLAMSSSFRACLRSDNGRFITNFLPHRSTNHSMPVQHLLRIGLLGHTRQKLQTPFRSRRMHVVHTHSAMLFAERLDLYPHPRQPLALDHVYILRDVFLQIGLND